ncbi:MAG: imidazoleglycerol-phosphate dehydratase HisB [Candidatus Bathyarchaeota archaeon]|nr:imidazoleglycerol-phosphate dehydratase HisB [Candidatus Bathyarchaeota archaeon]
MRIAEVSRATRETDIHLKVDLDGSGLVEVDTGVAFLDHMLKTLATHSLIDITAKATGDLRHHTVEDVSICLGEALRKALGDAVGVKRFGYAIVPMDCSLAFAAVDLANRPYANIHLSLRDLEVEDMASEDVHQFLETLAMSLRANVHIHVPYGSNGHHKVEAAFKALALSLRQAVSVDPRRSGVPSSKGVL